MKYQGIKSLFNPSCHYSTFHETDKNDQDKNIPEPNEQVEKSKDDKDIPKKTFPALGIILTLISAFFYSLGTAVVNLLPSINSIEILLIRTSFQFITFFIVTLLSGYSLVPESDQNIMLGIRCISGTITSITIFLSYRLLALADAVTIGYTSPVFVAIFSYFILNERQGILQWMACLITIGGVVFIYKPEFIFGAQSQVIYWNKLSGTVLSLIASMSAAVMMISMRKLKSTPVPVTIMWFSGVDMVSCLIYLLTIGQLVIPLGWITWGLLSVVVICENLKQISLTKAMQYESAGPVSIANTFSVVLVFVWQSLLLDQSIQLMSIIGAMIITSCVLLLAIDNWRKQSQNELS